MAKLKPGDRVDCRVKEAEIVSPYQAYDEIKTFEIVSVDAHGYYLYVPPYMSIKETFVASDEECEELEIDKRFAGQRITYIKGSLIYKINMVFDGIKCSRCHEFHYMAVPNQPDKTFLCWSCKTDPYR